MRNNYCRSGCIPSDSLCIRRCDVEHLECVDEASDKHARPKNPKGRPITGVVPQGVAPAGGLLDTTPGFRGQGPSATGAAGIKCKAGRAAANPLSGCELEGQAGCCNPERRLLQMRRSVLVAATLAAASMTLAELLVLPVTAEAMTLAMCGRYHKHCENRCMKRSIGKDRCLRRCDIALGECMQFASDNNAFAHTETPRGRPIRPGARPQGVPPAGGLIDTTPSFPARGPAATGAPGINARPGAAPQIR
ncbi:MAG: hypothetical protein K2Z80_32165 [Xanthobacteraceae bacterium]|nr:hypothetical protein [Xanthobacteraceae bacterium]